jgi:CubicO group peptidase (beta-lactamase class C family)
MESGINARAIDFAKFGRLYLNRGEWNGKQVVPASWVEQSSRLDATSDPADFYQYFWWVDVTRSDRGRFLARGN